jgi:hypothetical protein
MKSKILILVVLFLAIGIATFAQSVTTEVKKETTTQTTTVDQSKTGGCAGHQTMGAKADCKWVDANNDGICDTCGKKDCKDKCATPASTEKKCPSTCPGAKSSGCTPAKDGKK